MKHLLFLFILLFLFLSLFATTLRQEPIEGTNTFLPQGDEEMEPGSMPNYHFYITWDGSFAYFGLEWEVAVPLAEDAVWYIWIDTDMTDGSGAITGTGTPPPPSSIATFDQTQNTIFEPEFCVEIPIAAGGNGSVYNWNGSNWALVAPVSYTSADPGFEAWFQGGLPFFVGSGFAETKITWAIMGNPVGMAVATDVESAFVPGGMFPYWPQANASNIPDINYFYDFHLGPPIQTVNGFSPGFETGTLPVELSSFNAIIMNSEYVNLQWTTQSETNLMGYKVWRNHVDNLETAININSTNIIEGTNSSSETNYNYPDFDVIEGQIYYYWLQSVDYNGETEYHGPVMATFDEENPEVSPDVALTKLYTAYPNPFNPSANSRSNSLTIRYDVREEGQTSLAVYNTKGQLVKTLVNEFKIPGEYGETWDGKDNNGNEVGSGVYFYRLESGNYKEINKVMLIK